MTNLDIIKYLAFNNPTRLAELLDDIYCMGWNNGYYAAHTNCERFSKTEIYDFDEWINQDALKSEIYSDKELAEWIRIINKEN